MEEHLDEHLGADPAEPPTSDSPTSNDVAKPEPPADDAAPPAPVEDHTDVVNSLSTPESVIAPEQPVEDVTPAASEPHVDAPHVPTEAEAADLGRPEGAVVESLIVTAVDLFPSEHATVVVSLGDGHYTFTTGEAIHAFVDDLLAAGRAAFGATHSGLYREQPQPPDVPVGLRDPESK